MGRLLAQCAWVAMFDAGAAVPDPYAWPAVEPATDEQRREHDRLMVLSNRMAYRARELGVTDQGLDALFGGP
jgi:hypothetical protein